MTESETESAKKKKSATCIPKFKFKYHLAATPSQRYM